MAFSVELDKAQLRRFERTIRAIPEGARSRILPRAVNKTATTFRSRTVKGIAADLALKQKDIRKGTTLKRAVPNRPTAIITVRGHRVPLIKFSARQTRRGVTYRIEKRGGRKTVPSGFIVRMPNSYVGAFKRRGRSRLPISELHGPSIATVFEDKVVDPLLRETGPLLERNLATQVELALRRGRS